MALHYKRIIPTTANVSGNLDSADFASPPGATGLLLVCTVAGSSPTPAVTMNLRMKMPGFDTYHSWVGNSGVLAADGNIGVLCTQFIADTTPTGFDVFRKQEMPVPELFMVRIGDTTGPSKNITVDALWFGL